MALSFCLVRYDGSILPSDHPNHKIIRLKGEEYITGEEKRIDAERAGMLLRSAPPGTVQILEGAPVHAAVLPLSAKEAARKEREHRARFPVDPVAALSEVSPLPEAVLKGIQGKFDVVAAFLDSGEADAFLASVALYCRLGGKEKIAELAARRAEAIK